MSPGPLLLPNLGGEEGADWRRRLREPRVAAAARLWCLLFDDTARVADGHAPALARDPAPACFGSGLARAAFPFLDGLQGCVAWLADRRARADPAAQGLAFPGPSAEVVERVHDKAFALRCAEAADLVPRELAGTAHGYAPEELQDVDRFLADLRERLAAWPAWTRGRFTLKPRFGTSGRGRFDARDGRLDERGVRAAAVAMRDRGGAVLEPWLDRRDDLSVQLHLEPERPPTLLGSLHLETTPAGGYRGHRGEVDARGRVFSGHRRDEELREAAAQIGAAVAAAGFHGVAGVDALTFDTGMAERDGVLRPVVEVNARFTMGTVVLGLVRRSLPAVRASLGLAPGARCRFTFRLDAPADGWEDTARAHPGSLWVRLGDEREGVQPGLLFTLGSTPESDGAGRADGPGS